MLCAREQMRKAAGLEGKMTYDPCISRQTPIYMTRPDVLKAIHADTHPNPSWPRDRPGWRYGKSRISQDYNTATF